MLLCDADFSHCGINRGFFIVVFFCNRAVLEVP